MHSSHRVQQEPYRCEYKQSYSLGEVGLGILDVVDVEVDEEGVG